MPTATGAFKVASWNEEPYWESGDGKKLTRARVGQTFEGDVTGDGEVEWLMSYADDGTARFVGLGRVEGTLAGRDGTFVVESIGDFDGGQAAGTWSVVPRSASGRLVGLTGEGHFQAPMGTEASFTLEYRFE